MDIQKIIHVVVRQVLRFMLVLATSHTVSAGTLSIDDRAVTVEMPTSVMPFAPVGFGWG